MSYVVGLTGGIGCGKTVVSDYLAGLGVPIIDTDVIARQIVEPGSDTLCKLAKTFGAHILLSDGSLNRDELRKIAFSSSENKSALDAITHPAIRIETVSQVSSVKYPYCVVVIPLLTADSPFSQFMQRVVAVAAPEQVRVERVMKRNNLSREDVLKIVNTQLSDEERAEFADDIIDNSSTIEHAKQQAQLLHEKYSEMAAISSVERGS